MPKSKRLTIFEGPDGAGKTTAAKAFAKAHGARYVHFGALPHIYTGLARLHVEAMMPAVLGYQDVVFDRSWLSEGPYGEVFRGGEDRLRVAGKRMLERLAMRCGAMVVRCLPPLEVVRDNYRKRKARELLRDEEQLCEVYAHYKAQETSIPRIEYDYTSGLDPKHLDFPMFRTLPHWLDIQSAGDLEGRILLVGEQFAEHKNDDPWYQWPFASFSQQGCSWWLTEQLHASDIDEADLLWVNADQPGLEGFINRFHDEDRTIIALGGTAGNRLAKIKAHHFTEVAHPQAWKRFHHGRPYPLIETILEALHK